MSESAPEAPAETTDTESPATEQTAPAADDVAKWKALARKHEAQAKANADAAKRLAEMEDANKSELQKLQERAEAAEKRSADTEARLLRAEIAAEKGLPAALAARLTGDTKEELEADAEQLLALVGKPAPGKSADALVGTRTAPAVAEDVDKVAARIFADS